MAKEQSELSRKERSRAETKVSQPAWRRVLSIGLQTIAWFIAGVFALIIVVTVLVPRIIGAEPFTVVSGSMEPTIPTGSVVVSKHVSPDTVAFRDVVTYQLNSGEPLTVTHRVIGVDNIDGETRFKTQGDANTSPDPEPVRPEQIRGVVSYHVPFVGYLGQLVPMGAREGLATGLGIALIAYAVIVLIRSALGHRNNSEDTRNSGETVQSKRARH
ncbi:MAG: signal peptidase I [Brevibacterium aurantiacum]|uniref:Signal peptidase I n=1 Tax=Brevibacterium aurantiacum TaxID=273384 RepID=A0A2H1I1X1_BREAU|nr:signal peptidase I [Brevibacterium aurantiacum]MDN5607296.1 signal peptidase I [Brevibacterium sp.]MDN5735980.1 signal peptidase I [Brevibacterium aurantiacum]MDN5738444.1 signal peptidase I [Brevibacterium aurantiacum]MDN5774359.1 signal peptidase I [Brevibacterium aurantiacum]MDN5793298.1 signal peptidase I [Brevibacterium aurantiacum]